MKIVSSKLIETENLLAAVEAEKHSAEAQVTLSFFFITDISL